MNSRRRVNLEYKLIEHNRSLANNIIAGGSGGIGRPPYFMYVVVKDNKATEAH
jgi:hypothetical protein